MSTETYNIRNKLKRLKEMRYEIESDDFINLSGELESCEEFEEICLELAEEVIERESQVEVINLRIKEMQSRKQRIEHSSETLRNIVLQAIDVRGIKNIDSPALTMFISNLPPDVTITDESQLPSRFFISQPPKLDKKSLREAVINNGEVIDGATRGNGKISLTIRRK